MLCPTRTEETNAVSMKCIFKIGKIFSALKISDCHDNRNGESIPLHINRPTPIFFILGQASKLQPNEFCGRSKHTGRACDGSEEMLFVGKHKNVEDGGASILIGHQETGMKQYHRARCQQLASPLLVKGLLPPAIASLTSPTVMFKWSVWKPSRRIRTRILRQPIVLPLTSRFHWHRETWTCQTESRPNLELLFSSQLVLRLLFSCSRRWIAAAVPHRQLGCIVRWAPNPGVIGFECCSIS